MVGVYISILMFITTCIWAYLTRQYYSQMSLEVWRDKFGDKHPTALNVLAVMIVLTLIGFAYTAIYFLLR